jgi:hypothetical protein
MRSLGTVMYYETLSKTLELKVFGTSCTFIEFIDVSKEDKL